MDLSEKLLLQELKKGNRKAFDSAFNSHWERLYQVAYKVLSDEDMSKDAVQDVFVDLWSRKDQIEIGNLAGYLYNAVRYQCFKQMRTKRSLLQYEERWKEVFVNTTEEKYDLEALQDKLEESLKRMSHKHRLIFEMSRFQDLSNKEIAERMNLSQRTVEWYLYQVMKELKTSLATLFYLLTHHHMH
ncbi:RNA polymerase sigma-70 factor [Echinicola sediminis]